MENVGVGSMSSVVFDSSDYSPCSIVWKLCAIRLLLLMNTFVMYAFAEVPLFEHIRIAPLQ